MHDPIVILLGILCATVITSIYYYSYKIMPSRDRITEIEFLPITPPVSPETPPTRPVEEPSPKYLWDTPTNARHSVRVICDEEGLDIEQKNTMCATIGAESGWTTTAIGKPNSNGTRDWGIVQLNDGLWIGQGKPFLTTDYVLTHPEECVRWMSKQWKLGHRNWWIAYKNKSYLKYMV